MDTTLNKLSYLDEVICYYIQVVEEYSPFLSASLLDNWTKYRDLKKKQYYNNIVNNLSKLSDIEKKKQFNIDKYKCGENISLSFYNNLYKEISDSASSSLLYMIKYYDRIYNKKEIKVNVKLKKDRKISYILLDDGYYAHLRYEKKMLVINKSSFKNEVDIFKSSIAKNHMEWDSEIKPISSFEKRRRKIVSNSFGIYKKILSLSNSKVDDSYDIYEIYEICNLIIDDLYDDLISKNRDRDIYNKLMDMTKKQYGAFAYIADYDVLFMKFNKAIEGINESLLEKKSIELKEERKYVEFKNVEGIIPSVFDLYNILNERIINNVNLSLKDLRGRLNLVTTYMTIEEVIKYYKRLVELNNNFKYSVSCQKYFVKLISEKYNIPESVILDDYMKEEKIFN